MVRTRVHWVLSILLAGLLCAGATADDRKPDGKASGAAKKNPRLQTTSLKKATAEALGNIGYEAKSALPTLKEALEDRQLNRDRELRQIIQTAVRKIESSKAS